MNAIYKSAAITVTALALVFLVACNGDDSGSIKHAAHNEGDGHSHEEEGTSETTNRVSIPSSVRSNLGISFITVERRRIEQTLRVPGRFEYLPTARREYRTAVPGRVELLVEQFDQVDVGDILYRIDSPAWRQMQQQLVDADSQIQRLVTRLEALGPLLKAHEQHEESLRKSASVWNDRVEQLRIVRQAGGGRIDELTQAKAALASDQAEIASVQEKKAELHANRNQTKADLQAAKTRVNFLLDSASSIVSLDRERLTTLVETEHGPEPKWAVINAIEVRATEAGVVEGFGLTNGSWADEKTPVMTVVQPERLRFRALGLQSDLGVLKEGLLARIVPPIPTTVGRAIPLQDTMEGSLMLGLAGDPNDRTLELFVVPDELRAWARPGVSAQLEIVTDATVSPELSIPLAAVQRDGLTPVIFIRDSDNPNEAIRMEADLGQDDGRWVALLSGVRDGDEVVLDGAFQLMLAMSGSMQKGGHFHSDGTFHEGED